MKEKIWLQKTKKKILSELINFLSLFYILRYILFAKRADFKFVFQTVDA